MMCSCFGLGSNKRRDNDSLSHLPPPSPTHPDTAPTPPAAQMPDIEIRSAFVVGQLETGAAEPSQQQDEDLLAAKATDEPSTDQHSTLRSSDDALATTLGSNKTRTAPRATRSQSTVAAWKVQGVPSNELQPQPSGRVPRCGSTISLTSRPSAPLGSPPFSGFELASLAAQQAHALASMEVREAPYQVTSSPRAQHQGSLGTGVGGVRSAFASSSSSTLNIDPQLASRWAALGKPRASPTGVLQPRPSGPGPCTAGAHAWDGALHLDPSLGSDRSTTGDVHQLLSSERGTRETSVLSSGGSRLRMVQRLSDQDQRASSSSPPVSRVLPQRSTLPAPGSLAAPQAVQQPGFGQLPASRSMPNRRKSELSMDAALRAVACAAPGGGAAAAVHQLRSRLSAGAGASTDSK